MDNILILQIYKYKFESAFNLSLRSSTASDYLCYGHTSVETKIAWYLMSRYILSYHPNLAEVISVWKLSSADNTKTLKVNIIIKSKINDQSNCISIIFALHDTHAGHSTKPKFGTLSTHMTTVERTSCSLVHHILRWIKAAANCSLVSGPYICTASGKSG